MKKIVIFTTKYENELRDFAAKAAASEIIYINDSSKKCERYALRISIADKDAFSEEFLLALMNIAEKENPVYRYSAKLRKMARELRESPLQGRELHRLKSFFAASKEINIEGYVTFRMGEFREKLDTMIYSLVKKIKFSNGD
ncbi:MAG: putative sporulation protein YtxC [Defluviitaleaceae bacterium]|nr:putative sporulation protein YtxC [Defluviitaleaceae bacterium]